MEKNASIEERLDWLTEEVSRLRNQVETLSGRPSAPRPATVADFSDQQAQQAPEQADAFFTWVGRSSLLQRVSTLCFLLVLALILRTLTDGGVLDIRFGAGAGIVYATLLMLAGWYFYRRSSPLSPVFTVCGAVLMFLVVSETHARFASMPSTLAYVLIIGTGGLMALISHVSRMGLPIIVGTLGMGIAGVAIDYPNPSYPALVILLLSANALGFVASRLQRCSWLRWTLFIVTAALLYVWGYKIGLTLAGKAQPSGDLARYWFMPSLALFAVGYMATAIYGILRPATQRIARFDLALPVIAGVWAFSAASYTAQVWWGTLWGLAMVGFAVTGGYLGLALWLGGREGPARGAATGFFLGATLLLGLSVSAVAGSPLPGLLLVAGAALWAALLSEDWKQGSLRLVSYLIQFYVAFELGRWLFADLGRADNIGALLLAAVSAGGAFWQYRWSLHHAPPKESVFFSKLDEGNRLCIFLLLTALVHAYYFARGFYALSVADYAGAGLHGFVGMQSVLINIGAVLIMIWSLLRRDREMRNLAVLITLLGAAKVFFFDLFGLAGQGIEGFPLVASVFSLGVAVAVESLVLGRWLRIGQEAPKAPSDSAEQNPDSSILRG